MKRKKTKSQQQHAQRRALERYGLTFSPRVNDEMVRLIHTENGRLVMKQTNRVSVFDITYNSDIYRVVYDRQRKQIVTFLPKNEDVQYCLDIDEYE